MRVTIIFFIFLFPGIALSQTLPRVISKEATLKQIAIGYTFTEGPAVDQLGNVYFTDQPNNRILKWSTEGKIEVYMKNAGRANGLYIDNEGNLLACADEKNELWKISPDRKVTILLKDFKGKKFNGPNDLWVDPKGGIYFTDPFYKRPYWTRSEKEIEKENVYYLAPDKKTVTIAATGFVRPNGIIGTPKGTKLYVADINDGKTYVFKISPDGSLTDRKLFVEMGSDGMTIDHKGNIYLTGKGVTIFNKRGKKVGHIEIAEKWTANVTFGGEEQQTLFITAMQSLYTLEMKVHGVRWNRKHMKQLHNPKDAPRQFPSSFDGDGS